MKKILTILFFLTSFKLSAFSLFRIDIVGNGFADETVIAFSESASDSFNVQEDSYKLFSPVSGVPGICTKTNGYYITINQFNTLNSDKTLEIVLKIQANTLYTLKATDFSSIDLTSQIFLEDTQNGVLQDLRQNPNYNVQLQSGMIENRFYLHFKSPLIINSTIPSCLNNDAALYIDYNSTQLIDIEIKNEYGNVVSQLNNFNHQDTVYPLNPGNYEVFITYPNGYTIVSHTVITPNYPVENDLWASMIYVLPNEPIIFIVFTTNTTTNIWDFGDDVTFNTTHNNVMYSYNQPGQYIVKVISDNGNCRDTSSVTINVVEPNGINENKSQILNNKLGTVIYDMTGKELKYNKTNETPSLSEGFYIIKIGNITKKIYVL